MCPVCTEPHPPEGDGGAQQHTAQELHDYLASVSSAEESYLPPP
jgi:hypothetical protein